MPTLVRIPSYDTDTDSDTGSTAPGSPTTPFGWIKASFQRAFAPSARTVFLQAELHKAHHKNQILGVHTHELQSRVKVLSAQLEEERGSTKRKLDQLEEQLVDSVRSTIRDEITASIVSFSSVVSPQSTASFPSPVETASTSTHLFRVCGGTSRAQRS